MANDENKEETKKEETKPKETKTKDPKEDEEWLDPEEYITKPFKFVTSFDARFPNQNQTKHCWQNYVDYHKCINAKGEDFRPCIQFRVAFRGICPSGWVAKWDRQREEGIFPHDLNP